MDKQRIDYEVLQRIGIVFSENGFIQKKTRLLFASRLSWKSFNVYMKWMIGKNFILQVGDDYTLTDKGKQMFANLDSFMNSVHNMTIINTTRNIFNLETYLKENNYSLQIRNDMFIIKTPTQEVGIKKESLSIECPRHKIGVKDGQLTINAKYDKPLVKKYGNSIVIESRMIS